MLAQFSIVPLGGGTASVSPVVARVLKIVVESGIAYKANPMGTVVEGDWDAVMDVIRRCHQEALKDGERVLTNISIDDRRTGQGRIEKKLESVEQKIGLKLNR